MDKGSFYKLKKGDKVIHRKVNKAIVYNVSGKGSVFPYVEVTIRVGDRSKKYAKTIIIKANPFELEKDPEDENMERAVLLSIINRYRAKSFLPDLKDSDWTFEDLKAEVKRLHGTT